MPGSKLPPSAKHAAPSRQLNMNESNPKTSSSGNGLDIKPPADMLLMVGKSDIEAAALEHLKLDLCAAAVESEDEEVLALELEQVCCCK